MIGSCKLRKNLPEVRDEKTGLTSDLVKEDEEEEEGDAADAEGIVDGPLR